VTGGQNRGLRLPIEVISPDEFIALSAACGRSATGLRNRALLAVLYGAGLRLSEALGLYRKDLDFDQGILHVLHGKGNRRRAVGIDGDNLDTLRRWDGLRTVAGMPADPRKPSLMGPLVPWLCTLDGRRLDPSYCRHLLPRLAAEAGIAKRVHPHGLRHSLSAQLAAEGVPVNVIQQQLGHRNVATTSRYLEHVLPLQLIETMRLRRPLTSPQKGQ